MKQNAMHSRYLIYLGGDGYPEEADCEQRLASVVAANLGFNFISQKTFILDEELKTGSWKAIPLRLNRARKLIAELNSPVVLMGRSSGGRIATLLADLPQVQAAICLAYPFQNPENPPEEERYIHLAAITTPTLIIQGVKDNYGGLRATRKYGFSEAVEFFFVDLCHGFNPSAELLGLITMRTQRFLAFLGKHVMTAMVADPRKGADVSGCG